MTLSEFMSDFVLAGSDYCRLNDAVHRYLDEATPETVVIYAKDVTQCLLNAKKSVTKAVVSGSEIASSPELTDDIRSEIVDATRQASYWKDRVDLLEEGFRFIFLDNDSDYIDLMVRARKGMARMGDHARTYTQFEEDPEEEEEYEDDSEDIDDFETDYEEESDGDSEEEPEEEAEEENIDDSELFTVRDGEQIAEGEDPEEGEDSEGEPVTEPSQGLREIESEEELESPAEETEGSPAFDNQPNPAEVAQPQSPGLTKEDVQEIVLDTVSELIRRTSTEAETQAEEQPKKTTRGRKSASKKSTPRKSPVKKVREILKKDESDEEESP